jgi:hypothetical protein
MNMFVVYRTFVPICPKRGRTSSINYGLDSVGADLELDVASGTRCGIRTRFAWAKFGGSL